MVPLPTTVAPPPSSPCSRRPSGDATKIPDLEGKHGDSHGWIRALFEANGMTDPITLIRGRSTEVRLPQRADVLICELIGNEPLAERVIGITKDALRRLLKPGARLVPSGLKIFGLPATIPDTELSKCTFLPEVVQNWQSWYGMEFSPLSEVELFSNLVDFINPYTVRLWKSLGPPVLLADVDFKTWRGFGINKTKNCDSECLRSVEWSHCVFRTHGWSNYIGVDTPCVGRYR